jgi:hypothetical protein
MSGDETAYILNMGKGYRGDFTTTLRHHAVTPYSVLASSSGMLFSSELQ